MLFGCKPEFPSQSKIYLYLPCRMSRNIFRERKCLKHAHGNFIKLKFLELLEDLQNTEGLQLGNKLRSNHKHFLEQKMNVSLAV